MGVFLLLFAMSQYLFQCGFVSSCYLLRGEAENLCIPEFRTRTSSGQRLLRGLNYAG